MCVNDLGDSSDEQQRSWTSFLKMSLVCAYGSREQRLYFDLVTDAQLIDGEYLYTTFTTPVSSHLVLPARRRQSHSNTVRGLDAEKQTFYEAC